jgi:hypothetical protein
MDYSAGYGYPIHGDCASFRNGFCMLSGVAADPNGAACPRFTPKRKMKTLQIQSSHPVARRFPQTHQTRMGQGLKINGRGVHGIGMGTGTGMGRTSSMTIRNQEREALTQRLKELNKRLEAVRERLERLRRGKRYFSQCTRAIW